MNKYIKFLVSTILIFSANVYAERIFKVDVLCDDTKIMASVLKENGEVPIVIAKSDVDESMIITVWMGKDGSLTVTQSSNQLMCLVAAGSNAKYRPLPIPNTKLY